MFSCLNFSILIKIKARMVLVGGLLRLEWIQGCLAKTSPMLRWSFCMLGNTIIVNVVPSYCWAAPAAFPHI